MKKVCGNCGSDNVFIMNRCPKCGYIGARVPKSINGQIIIKTKNDLAEIINKRFAFIIRNEPKMCDVKREGDLICLYDDDVFISESHVDWYLQGKSFVFIDTLACHQYLIDEKECELIAEAIYSFRKNHGHTWKSKLRDSFENGSNENSYLQRFRNQFDFSILNKITKKATVREIIFLLLKNKI